MAMNGLTKMATTMLLLVLAVVPAAMAVTYTVGDTGGWTTGVDYTTWTNGKTFRVGDTLEFKYGATHSVREVNKAGYDSCGGTPINTYSSGDDKVDLDTAGAKYFICPTPGHCSQGMKLAITVVAAGTPASPTPPSTPDSPPATPSTPDSPPATPTPGGSGSTTSPPPPPKASGASKGLVSYVLVGVSMALGYGLFM